MIDGWGGQETPQTHVCQYWDDGQPQETGR